MSRSDEAYIPQCVEKGEGGAVSQKEMGWEQPDHPRIRDRVGKNLTRAAWSIEVIAALVGLFIALATGYATREELLARSSSGMDAGAWLAVIIGSLPFVMVAIVELTKIPLATAAFFAQSIFWRAAFSIALILLVGITFETMMNGLQRTFEDRIFLVNEGRRQLDELEQRTTTLVTRRSGLEQLEESQVRDNYQREIDQLSQEQQSVLNSLASEKSTFQESLGTGDTSVPEGEIERLNAAIVKEEETLRSELAELDGKYRRDLEAAEDNLQSSIDAIQNERAQLNQRLERATQRREERLDKKPFFSPSAPIQKAFEDERAIIVPRLGVLTTNEDGLRSGRFRENLANENERRKNLARERSGSRTDAYRADLAPKIQDLDSRRNRSNDRLAPQLENFSRRERAINEDFTRRRQEASARLGKRISELEGRADEITSIDGSLDEIRSSQNVIRAQINDDAKSNQIYQIAQWWFDKDAPADVTRDELGIVQWLWFGSLAGIVAITGTVLAFAGLVVRYHQRTPHHTFSYWVNTALAPNRALMRSLRRYVVSRRRMATRPIERVVERTVEVPKEVVREVPVEKVVFRDVPREVVKKLLVYVPFYTNDPELLKTQKEDD
jgi:hypothetical protein